MRTDDARQLILSKLTGVLDPCSCMTDTPLNIVELGLVDEIELQGNAVTITLVATSPMCLYMPQIIKEAEEVISGIDWVDTVDVVHDMHTLWYPARMEPHRWREKQERYAMND